MIAIPGYQILEKVYESSRSLLYRSQRNSDRACVILKILRQEYPSPQAIARFQMEYEIICSLNLEGVIKAYGLEFYQQSPVIVLEDFGAESLQQQLQKEHNLKLEEFLSLAIKITAIIGEIHQYNIIHKDINPSNIVLNRTTGEVKIIDFGIATALSWENPTFRNLNILEGTLAYMSPEQTGRMNRMLDYRTDFYSLGVTFYQLLCDRLPFETTDAIELVHSHIARQAISPHELTKAYTLPIPEAVSNIIMKLLSKNAEARYQSAKGILADLQECLNQFQQNQSIESFPLGRQDISSKLQISQKLYGREPETKLLTEAFQRVSTQSEKLEEIAQSKVEFLLIFGYPGTGKTKLVQEVYKPINRQGGYFITGKFEQLQRHVPYSALIQAFQELVCQLLGDSEKQIAIWREKLLSALGNNGKIIIDVIPEIELIIGKQANIIELPPAESENRFKIILKKFISVFAQSDRPLIIFLDDLQWADRASLQFIQQLITKFNNQSLLLIGAYRNNEVSEAHPLSQVLNEIRYAGKQINQIILSPLTLADIHLLIKDTLHYQDEQFVSLERNLQVRSLVELITQKTGGNPFFINEFFRYIHQQNLLYFDTSQGAWQWNLAQIRSAQLTDNVVELVTHRIEKLPAPSMQALSLAACIGSEFDLQTLAIISERSPTELAKDLSLAIQESLIAPFGDEYLTIEFSHDSLSYKFLHDRIQQAAYLLIPERERNKAHLKIGQQLLKSTPSESLENKIFDIVKHLNMGITLINEQKHKYILARLNLMAGKKAKASVAYESALKYFTTGLELLAENSWEEAYKLTLSLYELVAEAAYLNGNYEQMEQLVKDVLNHATSVLEKTNVYLIKIQADIAQNRMLDAIQTGRQFLELLDIKLPETVSQANILQGFVETKRVLADRTIEDLLNLPKMTDRYKLAAMEIIASVCTPTYFLVPDLWKLMVFQKIQLSVNYGNAPGSAFGYADYGMLLCSLEENIDAAYQFSQLATALQPQLNAKEFIPKTFLLVNIYLKHWREHLKETLNPLLEAYQCGVETGDLEYATFAIAFRFYHSYLLGRELSQLEREMASYETVIDQFKQQIPSKLIRIYRQSFLKLIDNSPNHSTENILQQFLEEDRYSQFHFYLNQLIICYLFQDYSRAKIYAVKTEELIEQGAIGLLVVPVFYFYDSLVRIALFPEVSPLEQEEIFQKIASNQVKMRFWADHAPMNYLHKFHLVEAEKKRILRQHIEAADEYDRAIDLAKEHEYLNEEALANELAAKFYLARGKIKIARTYFLDAHYCYLKWGAIAKINDLNQRYPEVFNTLSRQKPTNKTSSHTTTSSTVTEALDLASLMKASQALSGEIVLDKLLVKLITILIENAGAEKGCLILEMNGKLQIEAEGSVKSNITSVMQGIPVDSEAGRERVALAIVNYVVRTKESLVLNNATQEYQFNRDYYILKYQPKSILCTPLIYQEKLSGILYLENNLTTDAFPEERLKILQFLLTQAAISIDNAQLYNQLEQRVEQRTIELTQTNDRLQAEIVERQLSEQTLKLIVEGTSSVTGEDFFRSLVHSLAQALNVRYAFISGCIDPSKKRVRTFAFWHGNDFSENFEYDISGSPCEQVINSKSCQLYPANIKSLFPEDEALIDLQAESYLGIALLNSTGEILGHLAVLDDKAMENKLRNQMTLEIFAVRASTEMERRQAEIALQMSEEKFSKAFRSSPDAIILSRFNDGRFIEINESCLRMFGYSQEEMIGNTVFDLGIWAKTEDRDRVVQMLQENGSCSQAEFLFRRKSKEVFPVLFAAEMFYLETEPYLLSVVTDITALKQAEKALERLAEIGELAAMIVHEVRNPFTTILMALNAFKRLQLDERFQEYLSLALDESDRLQRLLNQILLYARPQTLHRSQIELNSFISEMLTSLQNLPIASQKQLNFIPVNQSIQVSADKDKLKQVLINLVMNAYEAIDEGETITIQIQEVENERIQIQIHNGGSPIPEDVLPQLTKPFFTTKPNGNGLGLAIVKRIVEAHSGNLQIESSTNRGTIVKVDLPLARFL